jgi:hypothetical protein
MTAPMAIASEGDLAAIVRDEGRLRDWYDATLPRVYRFLAAGARGAPLTFSLDEGGSRGSSA